jgi:hypothetical protein
MTQINPSFCSQLSQLSGEQIFGTATETKIWFILEYAGPWGAKALEESDLPEAVKTHLFHWLDTIPGSRLQLIKQGALHDGITFFIGLSSEETPLLYRFRLEGYEDLLTLNVPAILTNDAAYTPFRYTKPLFLVCTNGKRDQCCAKWGLPVYQALADYVGEQVWQTTHTGGHRFAATLIGLPHGICYGRVKLDETKNLVDAYQQEMIYQIDRYRGRSCYDSVTQVADAFLREHTENYHFTAFQHLATQQADEKRWQVQFKARQDNAIHQLQIAGELSAFENPQSCNKNKREHVRQYCLEHYEICNCAASPPRPEGSLLS